MDTTLLWDDGQAAPTLTVTINSGHTGIPKKKVAGDTHSLSPGIIGAIVAVSVLAAVCMVTAATLHRSWCMNPRCKVCLVLRCGRRKAQKGLWTTATRILDFGSFINKVGSRLGDYQISQPSPGPLTGFPTHRRKVDSAFPAAHLWTDDSAQIARAIRHW